MTRGRGRPAQFTTEVREEFLRLVRRGDRLGVAAATVGVSVNVPTRHARKDPAFAAALETARRKGKDARTPHGEYRYNHLECRCPICTTAATAARTARRHDSDYAVGGQVHNLDASRESPTPFSLPSPSPGPTPVAA
ncbi:hypothetical protein [Streptomyces sp. NPDC056169]|uniref:hypothetical protein n=1 Tax=Streptomyces sp. NPDC056169 TaxID=3345734 RepID=UPI0035DB7EC3